MVLEIPLTKGFVALIDDADLPLVEGYSWYAEDSPHSKTVYAVATKVINGKKRHFRMHRVILAIPNGVEVDHINLNGLDNRRANLRPASRTENNRHARKHVLAPNGFRGVQLKTDHTRPRPWSAKICADRKQHFLGYFATAEEAARAYDAAARRLHGEFALLNFPDSG